jgi:hypothetical protein
MEVCQELIVAIRTTGVTIVRVLETGALALRDFAPVKLRFTFKRISRE